MEEELWERIQNYDLEEGDKERPFFMRLLRENEWLRSDTRLAMEEYKKFIFLSQVIPHQIIPSTKIKKVWELHLIYPNSAWEKFCQKTLKESFRNTPQRENNEKESRRLYHQTLKSYLRTFKEVPPIEVWPQPNVLFPQSAKREILEGFFYFSIIIYLGILFFIENQKLLGISFSIIVVLAILRMIFFRENVLLEQRGKKPQQYYKVADEGGSGDGGD